MARIECSMEFKNVPSRVGLFVIKSCSGKILRGFTSLFELS